MKVLALMTTILAGCGATPHRDPAPALRTDAVAELAGRRAQLLGYLHDYTEAGVYPTDEAGRPISVFVDAKGVRCPMAELIYRSGHADLVDAVAKEKNDVRLAAITEGPLHDWMLGSGLTVDEIALVQGAADIDYTWIIQEAPNEESILARGEMRGRLETAERALRTGTKHSLEVAVAALPSATVPTPAVAKRDRPVVPASAMSSHAQGGPAATPSVAVMRRVDGNRILTR